MQLPHRAAKGAAPPLPAQTMGRLRQGVCTVDPGLIMVDMLYQLEKIGDCCFNIAQALPRRDYDASAWVA